MRSICVHRWTKKQKNRPKSIPYTLPSVAKLASSENDALPYDDAFQQDVA